MATQPKETAQTKTGSKPQPPKEIQKIDASALPDPKTTPLLLKLVAVRKHIGGFEKDSAAEQFTYVSGAQVLAKVLDSMNYLGLLLVPKFLHGTEAHESRIFERTNKWGTKTITDHILKAHVNMTWVDAYNKEEYVVPWLYYGEQENDIAQTFGSGLTYMERYFLMKFFNQPTDWLDPDAKKTPEGNEPLTDAEKAAILAHEAEQDARETAKKFIDKDKLDALIETAKKKGVPQSQILKNCAVEDLADLRIEQWKASMDILNGMPDKKVNSRLEAIQ